MSRSWGDCVLREFTDREVGSWGGWGGVTEEEGSGSEARGAEGMGTPGGLGKGSGFILSEIGSHWTIQDVPR